MLLVLNFSSFRLSIHSADINHANQCLAPVTLMSHSDPEFQFLRIIRDEIFQPEGKQHRPIWGSSYEACMSRTYSCFILLHPDVIFDNISKIENYISRTSLCVP